MSERSSLNTAPRPTNETYGPLQRAYEVLNRRLFDEELPNCRFVLKRRRNCQGYFVPGCIGRMDGRKADEIVLNPAYFDAEIEAGVLATLAHVMTHAWQFYEGTPGRRGYHNLEWAEKMREIGLQPSDTGKPGGMETGDRVQQYVVPGGKFDSAVKALLANQWDIVWRDVVSDTPETQRTTEASTSKSGHRPRFDCPITGCNVRAWAKHGAALDCGVHKTPLIPDAIK